MSQIEQRKYQLRDIKSIEDSWKETDGVMFQLPTGGGKSVIASQIVLNHKKEKILILAHRRRLLFQLRGHLLKQGVKSGMIVADLEENLDSNIVIASIRTIVNEKRAWILERGFDKIIIDEAHHTMIPTYQKVLDRCKGISKFKLLGITATPYRSDNQSFEKYYEKLICSDTTEELIAQKYLSEYKTFYNSVGDIDREVMKSGEDYQLTQLSNYMRKPEFIQTAIDSYKENGQEKQTIIFCVDKKHAKGVVEAYNKNGYTKIGYIDSEVSEEKREQILNDFESKKLQFIACIETLTEGVDLPETGCIQLLRPTNSLVLYLQMVGRGLRPKADGSECIILDCAGNTIKHGTVGSPKHWSLNNSLHPNNPRKKRKVVVRKKDGTFTEKEEDMEFGEMVELSEEEYILNIADSLEQFEKENVEIDSQVTQQFTKMVDYVLSKNQKLNLKILEESYRSSDEIGRIGVNDDSYFQINFIEKSNSRLLYFYFSTHNDYWNRRRVEGFNEQEERLKQTVVAGQLSEFFLLPQTQKTLQQMYEQVTELKLSKHDVEKFRRTIKEAKEQKFIREVEEHVQKYGSIEWKQEEGNRRWFNLSNLNQNWWGRNGDYIKIVFSKNKLLQNNDAIFYNSNGSILEQTSNMNLLKTKLIDELKRIQWTPQEIKQEVTV